MADADVIHLHGVHGVLGLLGPGVRSNGGVLVVLTDDESATDEGTKAEGEADGKVVLVGELEDHRATAESRASAGGGETDDARESGVGVEGVRRVGAAAGVVDLAKVALLNGVVVEIADDDLLLANSALSEGAVSVASAVVALAVLAIASQTGGGLRARGGAAGVLEGVRVARLVVGARTVLGGASRRVNEQIVRA